MKCLSKPQRAAKGSKGPIQSPMQRFSCRFNSRLLMVLAAAVVTLVVNMVATRQSTIFSHIHDQIPSGNQQQKQINRSSPTKDNSQQQQQYSFETIPSRTWKPFEHEFPCIPPIGEKLPNIKTPAHEGILFTRPTKVGSTTMTGIILKLAHNRGATEANRMRIQLSQKGSPNASAVNEQWQTPPRCKSRTTHGSVFKFEFTQRNKERSFLLSLVRDPAKRAISAFFHFQVSMKQKEPSDKNFQLFATKGTNSNPLIRYTTHNQEVPGLMSAEYEHFLDAYQKNHPEEEGLRSPISKLVERQVQPLNYTQIVVDILDAFDFIAVTERMDESLVTLKLLLGLSVEEILYAKVSRTAGTFYRGPADKGRPCVYYIPAFLTPGMRDYFYTPGRNDRWIAYSKGDALLHRSASLSLDRTINEVFGKERFATELAQFQNALAYSHAICTSEPDLMLSMCDATGHFVTNDPNRNTTCIITEVGCDHKCLKERVPNPIPKEVLEGYVKFGDADDVASAALKPQTIPNQ